MEAGGVNIIDSRTFFLACALVIVCEALFAYVVPHDKSYAFRAMLGLRLVETILILVFLTKVDPSLESIGLAHRTWKNGIYRGVLWCLAFALLAGAGMAVVWFQGKNPLTLFPNPIKDYMTPCAYLLGAGLIAPVAEEVFYRGVVFGFFRQWGAWTAILGSTALFVFSHNMGGSLPVTQTVGGLVFAWSYEREKSLLVPLMIHMSGNLAMAGLGMYAKYFGV